VYSCGVLGVDSMKWLSTGLLVTGACCVAMFVNAAVLSSIKAKAALDGFDGRYNPVVESSIHESASQSDATPAAQLLAKGVIRIDALGIEAAIFEGTSTVALDAGVGHIDGTAPLAGVGNIGLAAHRDSFFRGLKDTAVGQHIELVTTAGRRVFEVEAIEVVLPSAVSVLAPSQESRLTLITCYPFYFVGNAPKRFVVFARELN
jgi:sortase A